LEDALDSVIGPLERVFRSANVSPDQIRRLVQQGASSQSASLRPISVSTSGSMAASPDISRANSVLEKLNTVQAYRRGLERLPIAHPVASRVRLTSPYGMRRHPVSGRTKMHTGIDWAAARGTPILSAADGVVKKATRMRGYGNIVIIEHDFGLETYYAHLNSIDVRQGQRVSRGQKIGGMGTTGVSTGVHLHYEVRVNGQPVNPITYVRAGQNVFYKPHQRTWPEGCNHPGPGGPRNPNCAGTGSVVLAPVEHGQRACAIHQGEKRCILAGR